MGDVQQSGTDKKKNEGDKQAALKKRQAELAQNKTFGHAAGTEKRG